MWRPDEIGVDVEDAEGSEILVLIRTPVGVVELIGSFTVEGRVAYLRDAHIQGLAPDALGRAGLNAIGHRILVELDVDQIVIEGGTRTTGRNANRRPKPVRFPRSVRPPNA